MHRDVLNFNILTRCVYSLAFCQGTTPTTPFLILVRTEFLITTSVDGHVKFWKKQEQGIEFVKLYRAHLAPIVSVSASVDGQLFASVAEDGTAKVFDVINFGAST